ncbi:hypothetical protein ISREJYDI_CDS0023 [Pseudomonas phage UNO-G1W1]|uniref:Transposase n=1 Tax=Pseudomonas phage UNO-G1W1 TaxID=3136609 RepID=A0AAX4QMU5_9CAUD
MVWVTHWVASSTGKNSSTDFYRFLDRFLWRKIPGQIFTEKFTRVGW